MTQHATRSTVNRSEEAEYLGTIRYATTTALGWNITVGVHDGQGAYCRHFPEGQWGWNAFSASPKYLAAEWSQSGFGNVMAWPDDKTYYGYCEWFAKDARVEWPDLSLNMPTHAELEVWGITVQRSGKTDIYPYGDPRADEHRRKIKQILREEWGIAS